MPQVLEPPLGEHFEDIVPLPCRLSAGVLEAFTHEDWPGNVRELRNAVERAMIFPAPCRMRTA